MSEVLGVIPVRWASTRFPQKCLALVGGKPLTQWVWERAAKASLLSNLVVAADDERILDVVRGFGGQAVMTRADHPSGTDRVAEVATSYAADVIINIQGDEPLIDPSLIDRLAQVMLNDERWDMATAAARMDNPADRINPNCVKVVTAADGAALYFSRAPIPFYRDQQNGSADPFGLTRRHLGLYAYRKYFLQRLVAEAPCQLEQIEKLEQLRALYLGARMCVIETEDQGPGVDTPEDVQRAEFALHKAGILC